MNTEDYNDYTEYGSELLAEPPLILTDTHYADDARPNTGARSRSLFLTMPLGVIYHDANGLIADANPAGQRMLGFNLQELRGRTSIGALLRAVRRDGTPISSEEMPTSVALRTGRPVHGAEVGVCQPGSDEIRWLLVSATPEFHPGETKPYQVYSAFEDITERLQQEEALRQSEARLAEAQRTAHVGSWELDLSMGKRIWSEELFRIAGLDPADGPPDSARLRACYHPDDLARYDQAVAEMLATGQPNEMTIRAVRPDGQIRWCQMTARAVRDADGRITRIIGTAADITDRVRSEERWRALFDQSTDAIFLLAVADGISVLDCNPAAVALLGRRDSSEVIGHCVFEFSPEYQPDGLRSEAPRPDADQAIREGRAHRMEWTYERADGSLVPVEVALTPVTFGRDPMILAICRDLTEHKQSEAVRHEAETALRVSHERLLESEERLRLALAGGWLGWWQLDWTTGEYIEFSDQCKAHFGLPPDYPICYTEFQGRIHPADRERVDAAAAASISEHLDYEAEYRVIWPDGSIHWISAHGTPMYDENGRLLRMIGVTQDATERRQAEEKLRERTEVLESVLSTIPHQVFWKDVNSVYLGCNLPFAHVAGFSSPEEIIGKCDGDLAWAATEADDYRANDRHILESGEAVIDLEERYVRDDGSVKFGLTSKLPLHDSEGRVIGVLGISQDITSRKELEAEREELLRKTELLLAEATERADRDPLTNLLNHRAFQSRLEEEAARAEREGKTIAVAVLDLDNFQFFNDCYGHTVGDDVLLKASEMLQAGCSPCEIAARYGGDEFALILPESEFSSVSDIEDVIRAKMSGLAYRPDMQGTAIPITISIGAALCQNRVGGHHQALRQADERLLRAKTGGGGESEAQQIRATMFQRVQGFSMMDTLVTAVDNKDRYTRRHSEDVMTYSLQIARELGMSEDEQHTVAVAALLHDVGKIGVPDHILRKPGSLTDEEYETIKQHPQMGAIMVSAVPELEDTLDAVRHHHERWDGEGYPFGLRGEETPLIARLMAVADAFSAMTTDRPYRKGMERERALSVLQQGAGIQWDAVCVQAFLRAVTK